MKKANFDFATKMHGWVLHIWTESGSLCGYPPESKSAYLKARICSKCKKELAAMEERYRDDHDAL